MITLLLGISRPSTSILLIDDQAGREIRIMVKPEEVSEDQMVLLARDIAKKIEDELTYPGQIKVNLLRETKAIDYAK